MNTIGYLKQVKRRLGIESDYALAKALGVTQPAVSKLQKGTTFSDETALKIAAILELHPALVLADAHAEREKNPEIQAVWRSLVEKISLGFELLLLPAGRRGIPF